MTERIYYTQPDLLEFTAHVVAVERDPRPAVVLDRSAFYPTSGGQIFDTGWLEANGARLRVTEVADRDDETVVHFVEAADSLGPGAAVKGTIDAPRRRDHMQQHTGQHVLSAAFIELFNMPTVSFHMGDESCTIDLDAPSLTPEQMVKAEMRANHVVVENRPVQIRFASRDEAQRLGIRKIPADVKGDLRLIDIEGIDLCACGGTHVARTGQIGPIQVRKSEKVKQGTRVDFVCGFRALRHARRDLETLRAAAEVFSAHIWELPQQIQKAQEEVKSGRKREQKLLEEIAELLAAQMVGEASGVIRRVFADRDVNFIKLLAQKMTKAEKVVALLGSSAGQPSLVFAQTPGSVHDMGALMKQVLAEHGGRGGGSKDLAQAGLPEGTNLEAALTAAETKLRSIL
ncbi:MAG TPA: alanine--tRNA ligase-related protein [Terriglobales bacterium]|nr:alanine--tRNA ligase-related protein [Terriglobales bacterium]